MPQILASISLTELAPMMTILASMLAGFYTLIKFLLREAAKDRGADRLERKDFSAAMRDVADSNREIAHETKQGNSEAKERNGHLAELTVQSNQQMLKAIKNIKEQHVDNQIVDNQTIKK